jgi:hypothetical protein
MVPILKPVSPVSIVSLHFTLVSTLESSILFPLMEISEELFEIKRSVNERENQNSRTLGKTIYFFLIKSSFKIKS